jgi:hypothetical protein
MQTCLKSSTLVPLFLLALAVSADAKIITVNTENNKDFHAGVTNLVRAISLLADGDTIAFNIPNTTTNNHYLATPNTGYSVITNNNVTIDGYTQPGSSPNTNTILAANNAKIRIILDSTSGGGTSDPGPGFAPSEIGTLFVEGTNCHIRGLCLLGTGDFSAGGNSSDFYAIAIANSAHDCHVDGCWVGVDVNGTTLSGFKVGVAAFGDTDINNVPFWPKRTVIGVKAGPADTLGARAQHNVFCGQYFALDIESKDSRVSGNFFNVLPDGMHDVSQDAVPMEAMMEFGRGINNLILGTDGDGLNDAEERNVIGGVTFTADNNIIEFYGSGGDQSAAFTNIVIAGNYIGVAVDGVTRFTNANPIIDNFKNENGIVGSAQFGSDFDGVSDDIEANVISMNYPFAILYPDPASQVPLPPAFLQSDTGVLITNNGVGVIVPGPRVSVRGNKLMGNNLAPFSYADNNGDFLSSFTNYDLTYMSTLGNIIPSLFTNSTGARLIGTCAPPVPAPAVDFSPAFTNYTNIFIDVYTLDPEGWTNGIKFVLFELEVIDQSTGTPLQTNGFPQGKTYLGTFQDNGPYDSDPAVGRFNLNIASLGLPSGAQVTATANYSADPLGTHRGRVHTSNFANPVTLLAPLVITSISKSGSTITISWTGGTPPYTIQKKSPVTGAWSDFQTGISGTSTTDTLSGTQAFYRVKGQ